MLAGVVGGRSTITGWLLLAGTTLVAGGLAVMPPDGIVVRVNAVPLVWLVAMTGLLCFWPVPAVAAVLPGEVTGRAATGGAELPPPQQESQFRPQHSQPTKAIRLTTLAQPHFCRVAMGSS